MSVDKTPEPEMKPEPEATPVLRREALLPNERSRGLGTVAVVCTMAGVASGLALATTLMAMQVADSMTVRTCAPYRVVATDVQSVEPDHGFLGIRYVFRDNVATIDSVLPGTPAEQWQLQPGDHVLKIDGMRIDSSGDLQERIYNSHPGAQPELVIERSGSEIVVRPTLAAWPVISY